MGKHDRSKYDGETPREPSNEDRPKGKDAAIWSWLGSKVAASLAVEAVKRWVLPLLPW